MTALWPLPKPHLLHRRECRAQEVLEDVSVILHGNTIVKKLNEVLTIDGHGKRRIIVEILSHHNLVIA